MNCPYCKHNFVENNINSEWLFINMLKQIKLGLTNCKQLQKKLDASYWNIYYKAKKMRRMGLITIKDGWNKLKNRKFEKTLKLTKKGKEFLNELYKTN